MPTPMQQQSNAVLNAYDEGTVSGLIMAYTKLNPEASNTEIVEFLRSFGTKNLDYWINWFSLD